MIKRGSSRANRLPRFLRTCFSPRTAECYTYYTSYRSRQKRKIRTSRTPRTQREREKKTERGKNDIRLRTRSILTQIHPRKRLEPAAIKDRHMCERRRLRTFNHMECGHRGTAWSTPAYVPSARTYSYVYIYTYACEPRVVQVPAVGVIVRVYTTDKEAMRATVVWVRRTYPQRERKRKDAPKSPRGSFSHSLWRSSFLLSLQQHTTSSLYSPSPGEGSTRTARRVRL